MRRVWLGVIAALFVLDLGAGAYLWWLVAHKAPHAQLTDAGTRHQAAVQAGS